MAAKIDSTPMMSRSSSEIDETGALCELKRLSTRSSESDLQTPSGRASTKSLSTSAIIEYFENGRRYAGEAYFMPNDDAEETRLAITHQAFLLLLDGRLTTAHMPQDTKRVLDIGSGPGDWAVAMGERFPNAQIIATDITSWQGGNVPSNVIFEIDDAQEEWTYSQLFDFIHIRGLTGAFKNWPSIYAEAYKHLKPGGVLEVADFGLPQSSSQPSHSYISVFNGACQSAAEKSGAAIGLRHLKQEVVESSMLKYIKTTKYEVPLGEWSSDPQKKTVGKMALIANLEGLEAMSIRNLTRELAWKPEAVRDLCTKTQEAILNPSNRASIPCHFMVARKLLTAI